MSFLRTEIRQDGIFQIYELIQNNTHLLGKYTDSADFVYYQRDNNIAGNLDHVFFKVYCPGYFSYPTYIHKMKI